MTLVGVAVAWFIAWVGGIAAALVARLVLGR